MQSREVEVVLTKLGGIKMVKSAQRTPIRDVGEAQHGNYRKVWILCVCMNMAIKDEKAYNELMESTLKILLKKQQNNLFTLQRSVEADSHELKWKIDE